jgi:hypothetical protein
MTSWGACTARYRLDWEYRNHRVECLVSCALCCASPSRTMSLNPPPLPIMTTIYSFSYSLASSPLCGHHCFTSHVEILVNGVDWRYLCPFVGFSS